MHLDSLVSTLLRTIQDFIRQRNLGLQVGQHHGDDEDHLRHYQQPRRHHHPTQHCRSQVQIQQRQFRI